MIGCSPWTVRQTLIPRGLPHFRFKASGRLIFYTGSSRPLDRKPTTRRKNDKVSLFKRGDVWWSYFYKDGIRHQYSTGTSNRRQAETIEAKLKEEVNNRRFQIVEADPNMTFGELAARFIASGSVRPHHNYHLKFLLPCFSDTPVLRLTKSLGRRVPARAQEPEPVHQGRDHQPGPECAPAHSLLGRGRAAACCKSTRPDENGPRAAHPASGAERRRGAIAARCRERITCAS